MDCTEGIITEKNIEDLKYLESLLSYPPRFRLRFEYDDAEKARTEVTINFNGITSTYDGKPHIDKIVLKKPSKYNVIKNVEVFLITYRDAFLFATHSSII